MTPRFDLVIFDCDGVLIDSEVISTRTLREALAMEGLDVDLGYVRRAYLGRAMAVVLADFETRTGRALPAGFEDALLERLVATYRRELRPMPGVRPIVEALGARCCVATSSSLARATLSLDLTGLLPLFEGRVFSAAMVAHGKPAPDLFLHAAATMRAEPRRCLVIEDSEAGIEAAARAGMTAWRFVGGAHFDAADRASAAAHPHVPSFHTMQSIEAALAAV